MKLNNWSHWANWSRGLLLGLVISLMQVTAVHGAEQPIPPSHVNINTADAKTMAVALNGVGSSKAKAIVAYREKNGPFRTTQDLTQVDGIGEAILAKNAKSITLK